MARAILKLRGVRINTRDELYANYDFEELKPRLGLLSRWLCDHGCETEAQDVCALDPSVPDADLQLLAALRAPEDKLQALKSSKEAAAKKAKRQREAKKRQAEKHRVVIRGLVVQLAQSYWDNTEDHPEWSQYWRSGWLPPSVFESVKSVFEQEFHVTHYKVKFKSNLATFGATGQQLVAFLRKLEKEYSVAFSELDISGMKTVGDLTKTLYRRMVHLAFRQDAPLLIAGYRQWLLLEYLHAAVCSQLKISEAEVGVVNLNTTFVDDGRCRDRNAVHATAEDIKAICEQLENFFAISFLPEDIGNARTVAAMLDILDRKMLENAPDSAELKELVEAQPAPETKTFPIPDQPEADDGGNPPSSDNPPEDQKKSAVTEAIYKAVNDAVQKAIHMAPVIGPGAFSHLVTMVIKAKPWEVLKK